MKNFTILRLLQTALLSLAIFGAVSCGGTEESPAPSLQIKYRQGEPLREVAIAVPAEGGSYTVTVTSSYEWKIKENFAEDIIVSPKTAPKGDTNVTITVGATEEAREVIIEFSLKEYASPTAALIINQAAPGPASSDILYFEDAGSDPAAAEDSPAVAVYTGWSRQSPAGIDQAAVSYSGAASVRNTGTDSSQDGFSGHPNIFMNSENGIRREFAISGIDTGGNTNLVFRAAAIASAYPDFIPLTPQLIEFWAGYDGEQWAKLPIVTDESNSYSWVSAEFAVAQGTQSIYIKIATLDHHIRLDDFTLAAGGKGQLIEIPPHSERHFSVTPMGELQVGATVEEVRFAVSSDVKWSVQTTGQSDSDIAIDPSSGNGNGTVTVTFGKNSSQVEARRFTIEFSTADPNIPEPNRIKEFTIEQSAVEVRYFSVAAVGPLDVDAQSVSVEFSVESDVDWNADILDYSDGDYYLDPGTGSGDGTVTLFFGVNESTKNARYFVIEFSTEDERVPEADRSQRFTVSQLAAEEAKFFSVTPPDELDVAYDVSSVQFNISSNVDWSVSSGNVAVPVYITPTEGNGDGTVTVFFGENAGVRNERLFTINFSTAEEDIPEQERTFEFTIKQDPHPALKVWERVTLLEDITAGDYVIVFRHDSNSKYYALPVAAKASNPVAAEVIIGGDGKLGGIAGSGAIDDSVIWTFTGDNETGFTVGSAREQPKTFLESKNEAQGIKVAEATSSQHRWSVIEDVENKLFMRNIGISDTRNLAVFIASSGEPTWRYYTTGSNYKGELVLFKSVEATR